MKFNDIFDSVLTFLAVTLLSLVLFGYFVSGSALVLSSVTVAIAVLFITLTVKAKRSSVKAESARVKSVMQTLAFMGIDGATEFIKSALKKRYTVINKQNCFMCGKIAVYCFIRPRKLTLSDFADIYGNMQRATDADFKSILCAYGAEQDVIQAAAERGVCLVAEDKIYRLLELLDSIPPLPQKTVKRKRNVFNSITKRKFARRYFITALTLLIFAAFIPYGVYYTAVACVCVSLGIISLIPKKAK